MSSTTVHGRKNLLLLISTNDRFQHNDKKELSSVEYSNVIKMKTRRVISLTAIWP